MADTATVTITLRGVRLHQVPRLGTTIRTYIQRFGSSADVVVVDDQPKPVSPPVQQPAPASPPKPEPKPEPKKQPWRKEK